MGNNLLFPQPQLPANSIDEKTNSLGYVTTRLTNFDTSSSTTEQPKANILDFRRVFRVSKPLNSSESKQIKETLVNPDSNITTCQ